MTCKATAVLAPLVLMVAGGCGSTSAPAPDVAGTRAAPTAPAVRTEGPVTDTNRSTMRTAGGRILTAAGEPVVLRGVNEMFAWSDDPRGEWVLDEIARTGANAVRIVTTTEFSAADLDAVVANAIERGLIPVPECHSATGRWDRLERCVDYWVSPEIAGVLQRHEQWVLLNIANEAGDSSVTAAQFTDGYTSAITRIRNAGIRTPLIVDGVDWGKEYRMLLDAWSVLNENDPLDAVIASAHTYWVGSVEDRMADYRYIIDRVTRDGIPFIIGEGPTPSGWDCTPSPYDWAMTELDRAGIGWLAWSWGVVDNGDCDDPVRYDITNGGRFGDWETEAGRMIAMDHPASIRNTSRRPCSIPNAGDDCVAPVTETAGRDARVSLTPRSAGQVVLVHGAWGGGWDWRPVDRMLTDRGYDVYRVTLTGLGERVHLVGPAVDLSTHIADVVNTILFEDLQDVVLVGHSYGGMVITGVADSIAQRLDALVYVDAFVPHSGETVADIADGLRPEGEVVTPSWVDPADPYPRDVPHPSGTLTQPLELDGEPGAGVRGVYVLTVEPGREPDGFQWAADRAAALGWTVYELEADHNPQRSALPELVRIIEEVADG